MDKKHKKKSLAEMSDDALERAIDTVTSRMIALRNQLETAKSEVATEGKYSDTIWFRETTHKLRLSGHFHQKALRERGKRSHSPLARNSVEETFLGLCRARLDPDFFAELMDDAKEMSLVGGSAEK